ncbi:MAG: hypothetical protein HC781_21205 [Leptolyngbyaceae cyanobacterium CSU_1_4]|nr:hypothetical protein [Leptolyngbyaceae cyanobacterium CSU_1_4]
MKKIPWLSLGILFSAYATFSWFLTHWVISRINAGQAVWAVWALVLSCTLLQALLLTTLFDGVKHFFRKWLKSDIGYFSLIMLGSLGVTAALVWFKLFGYVLVLVSAEILVRLDLQNAHLNRWQSLAVLTLVSVAGLAVGWGVKVTPLSLQIR